MNGYVIVGHDPARYADALVRLVRDPDLCKRFSETNRGASHRFSLQSAAQKYAAVAAEFAPSRPTTP